MRVICVHDGNRPSQIPIEKWVKFGDKYTIDKVMRLFNPKPDIGFTLKEIVLDESNSPYKYFGHHRFKVLDSDELLLDAIEREVKEEKLEVVEL